MFQIASVRMKRSIQISKHQDDILLSENSISKNLICAIDIHRKAIMYANSLIANFEMSFFFLIVFGVLTLSFSVFRMFQIASSTCNISEIVPFFVSTSIAVVYMFFANFMGQEIINHNNKVYEAGYEIPWYLTSRRIQTQILFLLQRSTKIFGLNVGGLYIASLQCFATIQKCYLHL
ncbi:odorant receptor 43a-like isoform X2 [Pseudomyrmex gracilis]|uniref:odorant receptor 43a-like isoform X2 n=1 Tax=Pseudomyrmex gracilis TaxID=219809 RepID=UPI0009958CA9|nr:odorant receptor 43a-like isoform X2 [Pseudomyrmex gracilis]